MILTYKEEKEIVYTCHADSYQNFILNILESLNFIKKKYGLFRITLISQLPSSTYSDCSGGQQQRWIATKLCMHTI